MKGYRKKMNRLKNTFKIFTIFFLTFSSTAYSHCQIPCGIYDDYARVTSMLEDVVTIRKSIDSINTLSGKQDAQSTNQIVRFIMNKEEHAQKIIATISDYFLTQRVKSSQKDYSKRLIDHHGVIVAAMKVKQNVDKKHVAQLETAIQALLAYYPKHQH